MVENEIAKAYLLGMTCEDCEDYTIDVNNKPYCDNRARNINRKDKQTIPDAMSCIFWEKSKHPGSIAHDFE